MKWLAEFPATNVRILVTLIVFVATGWKSGFGTTHIEGDWLIFLGVMAGVDFAQHLGKRLTYKPTPPGAPDVEDVAAVPDAAKEPVLPPGSVLITQPSVPALQDALRKEGKHTTPLVADD
jgi:hypothetical protein